MQIPTQNSIAADQVRNQNNHEQRPLNVEVIAKEQYTAQRQINFVNQLIEKNKSANPHPLLGSQRANLVLQELDVEQQKKYLMPQQLQPPMPPMSYQTQVGQTLYHSHRNEVPSSYGPNSPQFGMLHAMQSNQVMLTSPGLPGQGPFTSGQRSGYSQRSLGPQHKMGPMIQYSPQNYNGNNINIANQFIYENNQMDQMRNNGAQADIDYRTHDTAYRQDRTGLLLNNQIKGLRINGIQSKSTTPILADNMNTFGVGTQLDNSQIDINEQDADQYSDASRAAINNLQKSNIGSLHVQNRSNKVLLQPQGYLQKTAHDFQAAQINSRANPQFHGQPSKESLANWTAKSSANGDRAVLQHHVPQGTSIPGFSVQAGDSQSPFNARGTQNSYSNAQPPTMANQHQEFDDLNFNFVGDSQRAQQQLKANLEKKEIDKFLKQVRARKQINLYADPKIKYEQSSSRFKTLGAQTSPIKIWGVRKPSKLPTLDNDQSLSTEERALYPYPSQAKMDLGFLGNRRNSVQPLYPAGGSVKKLGVNMIGKRSESLQFAFGNEKRNSHAAVSTAAGHSLNMIGSPSVTAEGIQVYDYMNPNNSGQTLDIAHSGLYQSKFLQDDRSLPVLKQVLVSPKQTLGGPGALRLKLAGLQSARNIKKPRWKTPLFTGPSMASIQPRGSVQMNLYNGAIPEFDPDGGARNVNINHVNSIQQLHEQEYQQSIQQGSTDYLGQSQNSDNFYRIVEQLPQVPLSLKLQAQQQINALEKQIRLKKAKCQEMVKSNKQLQLDFHEEFDRKKKLKKAAKEVLLTERARDKAIEKEEKKLLGIGDTTGNPTAENSHDGSPGLGRGISGSGFDNSNTITVSPLPDTLDNSATRRREAKIAANKPKIRTEDEKKVLKDLAQEETRIYKLYKDYAVNDLKRDKKNAIEGIKQIKVESRNWRGQLESLMEENVHKKKTIARYQQMIKNFEEEFKAQQEFIVKQEIEKALAKTMKSKLKSSKIKTTTRILDSPDPGATGMISGTGFRVPENGENFIKLIVEEASVSQTKGLEHSNSLDDVLKPTSQNDVFNPITATATPQGHATSKNVGKLPVHQFVAQTPGGNATSKVIEKTPVHLFPPAAGTPGGHSLGTSKSGSHITREYIDIRFVNKLQTSITYGLRHDKGIEMVLSLIEAVQQCFGCQKVTFFPVDFYVAQFTSQNISKDRKQNIYSVTFADEDGSQQEATAIARHQHELVDTLAFKSLRTFDEEIFISEDGQQMGILIRQCKGDVPGPSFILQAEFRDAAAATVKDSKRNTKTSKIGQAMGGATTFAKHFTLIQAQTLQMYLINIQLKFERLRLQVILAQKNKKNEVAECIAFAGRILKQRTLKNLLRSYTHELPIFFGFDEVSIMFHDEEKNNTLYTITTGDDEDQILKLEQKKKSAKSDKAVNYIDAMMEMRDSLLSPNQLIQFPISAGITSSAYKKQKTHYFNDFTTNNIMYVAEIDNIKSIEKINNIMVGCVQREDGTSNGIIQLFNSQKPIVPATKNKFDAVSRFIGQCIQNVEDLTKKLTQTLAVTLESHPSEREVNNTFQAIVQKQENWDALSKPLAQLKIGFAQTAAQAQKIQDEANKPVGELAEE